MPFFEGGWMWFVLGWSLMTFVSLAAMFFIYKVRSMGIVMLISSLAIAITFIYMLLRY